MKPLTEAQREVLDRLRRTCLPRMPEQLTLPLEQAGSAA